MSEELGYEFYDIDEYLMHYGVGHLYGGHSGRYPWGSGDDPYQDDPEKRASKYYDSVVGWINDVKKMDDAGVSLKEQAEAYDLKTATELRAALSVAKYYAKSYQIDKATKLRNDGKSLREIAKIMGYENDSSVRQLLKEDADHKRDELFNYADILKENVDKYDMIDIGKGSGTLLGISNEMLDKAVYVLKAEYGYEERSKKQPQLLHPGQYTTTRVLVKPNAPADILYKQTEDYRVRRLEDFGDNPNPSIDTNIKPSFSKPVSVDRNRVMIVYRDEEWDGNTGLSRDGTIELRPGVKDLSLSGSVYSQIRTAINNDKGEPSYYIKGVALYGNKFPDGVDILVYSNKYRYQHDKDGNIVKDTNGNPIPTKDSDVFKKLKTKKNIETGKEEINWDDPFGSRIKDLDEGGQYYYIDSDGKEKLGAINKRADEGDWLDWSNKVPAQFLAKQNYGLVKNQLEYTIADRKFEFEEIKKLTNPAVKQRFLEDFADSLDSQAVHLKAAAFPRQHHELIVAVNSLKDNECYAPNYDTGEQLALIRFPHAGTFEIPILTVNNKNEEGKRLLGKGAKDVIGINSNNAGILSGADFDGDTVLAIPISDTVDVTSRKPLRGLVGFEGKDEYKPKYKLDENGNRVLDENGDPIIISKVMSKSNLQRQMGSVSNLITDMTLMGASDEEMVRAVKHSMVIVDSPKHKLDYAQSELDNGIRELKKKYQEHDYVDPIGVLHEKSKGAATIISRAKAETSAYLYVGQPKIDKETGEKIPSGIHKMGPDWKNTPFYTKEIVDPETGELKEVRKPDYNNMVMKERYRKSTQMAEAKDAMELVRDPSNKIEVAYANFANSLKAMANEARKEMISTENIKYNPEMAKKYSKEVEDLNAKVLLANKNRPREREANVLAGILYDEYRDAVEQAGESMDKEEEGKVRDRMMRKARTIVGAQRYEIELTPEQWEAIQSGAVTHTKAKEIFRKMNSEKLRELAMPKEEFVLDKPKINKLFTMIDRGYTTSEIAMALGVSISTVQKYATEGR